MVAERVFIIGVGCTAFTKVYFFLVNGTTLPTDVTSPEVNDRPTTCVALSHDLHYMILSTGA